MNTKFRLLALSIIVVVCVSIFANTSTAANYGIEGVQTAEMDEIVVSPLLADYSWDQEFLYDAASSDEKVRYYNQFMFFDNMDYPVGCTAVAVGQVIHYLLGDEIKKPIGSSFLTKNNGDTLNISYKGGQTTNGGAYKKSYMPVCPEYNALTVNGTLTDNGGRRNRRWNPN